MLRTGLGIVASLSSMLSDLTAHDWEVGASIQYSTEKRGMRRISPITRIITCLVVISESLFPILDSLGIHVLGSSSFSTFTYDKIIHLKFEVDTSSSISMFGYFISSPSFSRRLRFD